MSDRTDAELLTGKLLAYAKEIAPSGAAVIVFVRTDPRDDRDDPDTYLDMLGGDHCDVSAAAHELVEWLLTEVIERKEEAT